MEPGHKIMPTTYFIALTALSIGMHFLYPIKKILYPPFTYLGYLLIIIGIIINLWTDRLFKKTYTTVKPFKDPTVLLTSGPFRISRHPMYLGMVSILLGVAIIHGTIITFLFPILFAIIMEFLSFPLKKRTLRDSLGFNISIIKRKSDDGYDNRPILRSINC